VRGKLAVDSVFATARAGIKHVSRPRRPTQYLKAPHGVRVSASWRSRCRRSQSVDSHASGLTCPAKTDNFWAFREFTKRLACTATEYGISVEIQSEAWTTQECPQCGSTDRTTRHQDTLTCSCGFKEHADLTASETFLRRHQNSERSDWRTSHDVSPQRQTAGRGNHTLTVPTNSAQTRVPSTVTGMLVPGNRRPTETPTEETPASSGGSRELCSLPA
jgi:predicted RNA-binding Zn-ribbon protein involved in translation (DUF1610 family)